MDGGPGANCSSIGPDHRQGEALIHNARGGFLCLQTSGVIVLCTKNQCGCFGPLWLGWSETGST